MECQLGPRGFECPKIDGKDVRDFTRFSSKTRNHTKCCAQHSKQAVLPSWYTNDSLPTWYKSTTTWDKDNSTGTGSGTSTGTRTGTCNGTQFETEEVNIDMNHVPCKGFYGLQNDVQNSKMSPHDMAHALPFGDKKSLQKSLKIESTLNKIKHQNFVANAQRTRCQLKAERKTLQNNAKTPQKVKDRLQEEAQRFHVLEHEVQQKQADVDEQAAKQWKLLDAERDKVENARQKLEGERLAFQRQKEEQNKVQNEKMAKQRERIQTETARLEALKHELELERKLNTQQRDDMVANFARLEAVHNQMADQQNGAFKEDIGQLRKDVGRLKKKYEKLAKECGNLMDRGQESLRIDIIQCIVTNRCNQLKQKLKQLDRGRQLDRAEKA